MAELEMDERSYLLQSLDEALYCWDNRPWKDIEYDRKTEIKKFLRLPGHAILNTFILRFKYTISKNRIIPLKTKTFFGYTMNILNLEESLWLCGLMSHPSEIRLTRFIINNMSSNNVFFDIGAHHGFYTLLAHRLINELGEIHSFEPVVPHFNYLRKNTKNKKNIFINKLALYSKEGQLTFFENMSGYSTINTTFYDKSEVLNNEKFSEIKVTASTLDKYCQTKNIKPTFLKVDVEGAEYDVLCGAEWVLKTYSPTIIMEVWRSPYDYENHLKAINLLLNSNYRPYRINKQGVPETVNDIIPDRDIPLQEQSDNFLFMKT